MGTRDYSYRKLERLRFYVSYFWYKLILPIEVKSPRLRMWWYELGYTLHKFRDYQFCMPWKSSVDEITTRFGTFGIRVGTNDAANVSPAFERRDINALLCTIDRLLNEGKRVLFLDVGGDVGTYSVIVGNRFDEKQVDIICFEPVPANCSILRQNIARNGLEHKVEVVEAALLDEEMESLHICLNAIAPGSSSINGEGEFVDVRATRMDTVLKERLTDYDVIVMKLDVEGAEERVLRGADGINKLDIETHLVVEDFVDESIIAYLQESHWEFQGKYTDYNSWWIKTRA